MRICDRCKSGSRATTLRDLIEATEYDLCGQCLDEFKNIFLIKKSPPKNDEFKNIFLIKKSPPKNKVEKKEESDA